MGWQTDIRELGYDPAWVKDADEDLPFSLPADARDPAVLDRTFTRGCEIGGLTNCVQSKAVKQQHPELAEECATGDSRTFIKIRGENTILRFISEGVVARMQDMHLAPPPGAYTLRAPRGTRKLGNQRKGSGLGEPCPQRGYKKGLRRFEREEE